jgi:hypothetical protein
MAVLASWDAVVGNRATAGRLRDVRQERCFVGVSMFLAVSLVGGIAAADAPTKQQCAEANESAQDLRGAGRLTEARAALALCLSASCPRVIRADCQARLVDVEAAVPTIVLGASDGAGNDLTNVHVAVDGRPLVDKLDGVAIEVDPGSHKFTFQASGLPPTEKTLLVTEGDKARSVRVVLGAPSAPAPVAVVAPNQTPQATRQPHRDDGRTARTAALAMGAAGVVGVVIGSALGLASRGTYQSALANECHNDKSDCTPQGKSDVAAAFRQATAADVSFAVAGTLIAVGATIYFTAPRKAGPWTIGWTLDRQGGFVSARGSW